MNAVTLRPHRQQLAFLLRDILESGKAYDWDDLARMSGVPEGEIEWTCRRLYLDDGYAFLSIDRIMEAFAFSEIHNPKTVFAPHKLTGSPPEARPKHDHSGTRTEPSKQHNTNAYGFTRSGVKS